MPARVRPDSIVKAARYAAGLIARKSRPWALYHSVRHTRQTVAGCREIGKALRLPRAQMDILLLAAWFHDTGYVSIVGGHEGRSAKIAGEYLAAERFPPRIIKSVQGCILATRMPQRPHSLLQRVLCDADLISLGKRAFLYHNELLRQEMERREGRLIDERVWLHRSIRFLHRHHFTTRYGRTVLEAGKRTNVERVRRLIKRLKTPQRSRG